MLESIEARKVTLNLSPELGQLVEVRKRQWIVADVHTSQLPNSRHKKQHYVKLSSIDEDGLGEELEVIWEIEPGAHIIEKSGLPEITGFDDANKLDAFLDAVRWGTATNADRGFLQAPFRSGVSIEDFQLDPLVRAINMARVNLLIADDVGLGKTIEAGLVIQELLLRHRVRTVLIICPASLQLKWQDEMQEKFGLEFKIVNTDYVKHLRRERGIHANPWTSFPRLIVSQDWIKSGEGLRLLRETIPTKATYPRKFDMMVIDEAHNIAPSSSANYAVASQRTQIIREIAPHFQHKLFLTATPHNGYTESFTSLLEILDDQRFSRNILPDEKQLQKVMIRRLKTDLVDDQGEPLYPKRKLQALEVNYTELERTMHKKLDQYAQSREESNAEAKNAMATKFVSGLLKKRLFSSPASFASTLEKHISTVTKAIEPKQTTAIEERILRKAMLKAEEDYANDQDFEIAQEEAIEEASSRSAPLNSQERSLLNELRNWAQTAQVRL
jgi:superfamily II DNA or RNA helicase